MLFDIKKLSDFFVKKDKAITVALVLMLIAMLCNIVWYEFHKTTTKLDITQDVAITNASKIDIMAQQMVTQDAFTRAVVTRNSFNSYIKRKDDEYHEQMSINNMLFSKMGILEGNVSMFSEILDPFYFRKNNTEVDNE